jgi:hypothetical protein
MQMPLLEEGAEEQVAVLTALRQAQEETGRAVPAAVHLVEGTLL